jgi:hypothetical protein
MTPVAFHPFLLTAAFVLQLSLAGDVPPPGFIRPLLVAELSVAALVLLGMLALRSQAGGALIATLAGVVVVSYQPFAVIARSALNAFGMTTAVVAVALLAATIASAIVVVLHSAWRGTLGGHLPAATRNLNVFSLLTVLLVILPATVSVPRWLAERPAQERPQAAGSLPDVYLLLLDGYPRADELQQRFGFDNSAFLADLRERGFDVDEESHSNYPTTKLTLISMLTMDYLGAGSESTFSTTELRRMLHEASLRGAGMEAIRAAGFELAATAPGWEDVSLRAGVDRFIDRPEITDVERSVLWKTWLPDTPLIPEGLYSKELNKRVVGILEDTVELSTEPRDRPLFAFVHVPSPHLPLAFDAVGNPYPVAPRRYDGGRDSVAHLSDEEFGAAFVANVNALNQHVIGAVDAVLATADAPPVIIIMSDHGYFARSLWADSNLHNLFAAYTPGSPGLMEDAPTPVNLLRVLTRNYANAESGEMLDDRYFSLRVSGGQGTVTEIEDGTGHPVP